MLGLLFNSQMNATIKLLCLISNGMVLQRDVSLKIWGWANPSEKIRVEFFGKTYQTRANKQGPRKVEFPATAARGPFNLKVNEIKIKDILMGDVWLCSGHQIWN